jgi:hypothetical protein
VVAPPVGPVAPAGAEVVVAAPVAPVAPVEVDVDGPPPGASSTYHAPLTSTHAVSGLLLLEKVVLRAAAKPASEDGSPALLFELERHVVVVVAEPVPKQKLLAVTTWIAWLPSVKLFPRPNPDAFNETLANAVLHSLC